MVIDDFSTIHQTIRSSSEWESSEGSPFPTTSSIIVIPEETLEEALMRTNQEARAAYLQNIQATIGRMESNRSSQSAVDTNIDNDFDMSERHQIKRRRLQ
jgi:hypothetical protein